jgi:hypothetical protein
MPKLKEYEGVISQLLGYFSKNKGLNTVTAAVAVPVVDIAAQSPLLVDLVGAEAATYLAGGPAGWGAAALIIGARALMAFVRGRK